MCMRVAPPLALLAALAFGQNAMAQATTGGTYAVMTDMVSGPVAPTIAEVVVVGTVVEVEPGTVEVVPYRGSPKERRDSWKVAILKVEDPVHGASGITRVRVGFPADAQEPDWPGDGKLWRLPSVVMTGPATHAIGVALTPNLEGCFSLAKRPTADFYVLATLPARKKDPEFATEVGHLKRIARAINDPAAALKPKGPDDPQWRLPILASAATAPVLEAKDQADRFEAAQIILQRYLMPRGSNAREPIPDVENKLLVALLAELPWLPADGNRVRDGTLVPHREVLWYKINPGELGFKRPEMPKRLPGDPPVNSDKLMDEATTKFLKENADKIKLKRFVQK
jgi:hypothetical protein